MVTESVVNQGANVKYIKRETLRYVSGKKWGYLNCKIKELEWKSHLHDHPF